MRQGERGFTLIELMVVVAVVGILASLAVYLFSGQRKNVTAKSEVTAMFAEFQLRQEQYLLERGDYLSTGGSDTDTWPTAPNGNGGKTPILSTASGYPTEWGDLRMAPDTPSTRCAYVSIAGEANDASNIGTIAASEFNFTAPTQDWFYVLARCDMDQDSSVDSYYFQPSGDTNLYWVNQGK